MLLMVEKDIRGGTCHTIYRYAKSRKKYIQAQDKTNELSFLENWDVNNSYGWAMS